MKRKESGSVGKARRTGEDVQYIASLSDVQPFVKGIINLRGVPVPVLDMRLKFNLIEAEYTNFTVIIIIEFRERLLGMIVDSVSDILSIRIKSMDEMPSFRTKINSEYIQGIGEKGESAVIILDSDRILTSNEFELIYKFSEIAQTPSQR